MMSEFRSGVTIEHGTARVWACGELDVRTVAELNELLASALEVHGMCLLDLGALTFIDSSGLAMIVRAARRARGAGGQLVLRRPPPPVWRTIELAGLHDALPWERNDGA